MVPRIAERRWLVLYTDRRYWVISYISTLSKIPKALSGLVTGSGRRGSSLPKPISPAAPGLFNTAECTVSTDGDRAFHDKYLCWLLMLMASLQTAVKEVDVTDALNKSLEPSVLHPALLIGGSKRKTEQPCALRPCQLQGAIVVYWHWNSMFSAHTLQFTPTHHGTAPRHSGTKQAKWESTWPQGQSVYGVLAFSSVFLSEEDKRKSRLQTWQTLAFTKKKK